MTRIFADYNSTTPLCPPVVKAMMAWQHKVGNLSSAHSFGQSMHIEYNQASDTIRDLLGAHSYELLVCSSATEANHWWLWSQLNASDEVLHVIATALEHPCVIEPLRDYERQGRIQLSLCRVTPQGIIDLNHLSDLLTPKTSLVCMIMANNDIGTIQPIQEVVAMAHRVGARVHSDMVQAAGKLPVTLDDWGVDAAVISGHKCYAPVGCAVLLVKDADGMCPLFLGGAQQKKRRAGTVNVMGLDLFATGLRYCYDNVTNHVDVHHWAMSLCARPGHIQSVVPLNTKTQLWNTVPLALDNQVAHNTMMRLDLMGIAVGVGSACSTGSVDISPSVLSLGLPGTTASSVIRISVGYPTTCADLALLEEGLTR